MQSIISRPSHLSLMEETSCLIARLCITKAIILTIEFACDSKKTTINNKTMWLFFKRKNLKLLCTSNVKKYVWSTREFDKCAIVILTRAPSWLLRINAEIPSGSAPRLRSWWCAPSGAWKKKEVELIIGTSDIERKAPRNKSRCSVTKG